MRMIPFFSRAYLKRLYAGLGKSRVLACAALLRRLSVLRRLPRHLLIEYELLPNVPAALEMAILRHHCYVLNFDDNVWEKYAGTRLSGKFDRIISGAAGVIVANNFLAQRVSGLNDNWLEIPTAVDLAHYGGEVAKRSRFTLVWVGTPVTYVYLEKFADTLRAMTAVADYELLVLARRCLEKRSIPGVPMRFEDWSVANEAQVLASSHVGIMPLTDDPMSCGKSAYKIIQYLAAGLPVIASPVGENTRVLTHECGILAGTRDEWCEAVRCLAEDTAVRARLSRGATERAKEYSLQKFRPVLTDFMRKCCGCM